MEQPLPDAEFYQQEWRRVPPTFWTLDGALLYLRLLRPADAAGLIDLFERLSSEARRRRFHAGADRVSDELKLEAAQQLANVDNRTLGGAVIALERTTEGRERIVGVARLARPADQPHAPQAEAAVVVRDDMQGRGVGTELLRRLVLLARQMHVSSILAVIEADNLPALRVFRNLNLPYQLSVSHGETHMVIQVPQDDPARPPLPPLCPPTTCIQRLRARLKSKPQRRKAHEEQQKQEQPKT